MNASHEIIRLSDGHQLDTGRLESSPINRLSKQSSWKKESALKSLIRRELEQYTSIVHRPSFADENFRKRFVRFLCALLKSSANELLNQAQHRSEIRYLEGVRIVAQVFVVDCTDHYVPILSRCGGAGVVAQASASVKRCNTVVTGFVYYLRAVSSGL